MPKGTEDLASLLRTGLSESPLHQQISNDFRGSPVFQQGMTEREFGTNPPCIAGPTQGGEPADLLIGRFTAMTSER